MSLRPPASMRGEPLGGGGNALDDPMMETGNMSDDDNAQPDIDEPLVENEDPLLLAIDDLEGRVVAAIDEVKLHPGVRTSTEISVHEELAVLLRPVLEVAAHTGPSVARTYYRGDNMEGSTDDTYERTVSDLVLPVLLEMAQSDTIPAKRCASLEFFRTFWKECHKAGSWLDQTTTGINAGPYGPGGHSSTSSAHNPAMRAIVRRRQQKRLTREGEILRYWVEAAVSCLVAGVFTNDEAEGAVASRAIIAASASIRPSLHHISQKIKDADDRGAAKLYSPVMKMVEGVLKKLFLGSGEAVRSACIKFLEIFLLCCSHKPSDSSTRKKGHSTSEGFSLGDLPTGHPTITREALESIAEYAFTTLRGMTMMGGQVKIDVNTLSDMMLSGDGTPTGQVISILKPAALAYLEIESSIPKDEGDNESLEFELDRSNVEFDFLLSQKSYALTINAMSALALNRPIFFGEAAVCLARRAANPPEYVEGGTLTKSAVLVIASQLKASCLTLLRNAASITTGASKILHKALKKHDMELQADKALKMANQTHSLKTAGRAARNQARMYYEWDQSESDRRSTKRQKETDDALAQLRAAKKARGLGHGIQLPTSMSDAVDLVLTNLTHIPSKRPGQKAKSFSGNKVEMNLDSLIDAIMTNGASLIQEEGRWYDRDGGNAWDFDTSSKHVYGLGSQLLETIENLQGTIKDESKLGKKEKRFVEQCDKAATAAVGRIMSAASNSRSAGLATLGHQLTARLAFTLKKVQPSSQQKDAYDMAKDSITACSSRLDHMNIIHTLQDFADAYPLVASSLATIATTGAQDDVSGDYSLTEAVINEALLQSSSDGKYHDRILEYDSSLDIFVASVVHASELANDKPGDPERKNTAARASTQLHATIARAPRLTESALTLMCAMCDIEAISKKASGTARKASSQEAIAASAAAHAAMHAAEKRAVAVLLTLRDVVFQRNAEEMRRCGVKCVVGIASGRFAATPSIHDKALKLAVNILFAKNEALANFVVEAAKNDLKLAANDAIENFEEIQKANKEAEKKSGSSHSNPLAPHSELEKQVLDRMKKPAVLIMALCLRRPELIEVLFTVSSKENADVLSKAVRANMSKLSRAVSAQYGAAAMALRVAETTGQAETPMLLSFLENLAPASDRNLPDPDVISACFTIQEMKLGKDDKKDPRFLIPVVSAMKRKDLVERLPEFVAADDNIFLAGLVRMGDRVSRQALIFRDEIDEENPSLYGMTLCEQLVFLHKLDFAAAGLPQKRYLEAIKLCLNDEEVYNDRVLMAALDEMSGKFLTGDSKLPLAYMRTILLVCMKHESLHSWICHVLLPRLVEGKIWSDARQWEGFMRCAQMLEKSEDPNVNTIEALQNLPKEQLTQYKTKFAR